MRIGAGLLLIAVGAILRFGISTVFTHGVAIHTAAGPLERERMLDAGVRSGPWHQEALQDQGMSLG